MRFSFLADAFKHLFERRKRATPEAALASLTSQALAVPTLQEAVGAFESEVWRARRYERPLSILVLGARMGEERGPNREFRERSAVENGTVLLETRIPHLASLLMGGILTGLLRQSDLIAYMPEHGWFMIALPETDRALARQAVERIETVMRAQVRVGLRASISTFPDDGVTLSKLIQQAEHRWRGDAPQIQKPAASENGAHHEETDR